MLMLLFFAPAMYSATGVTGTEFLNFMPGARAFALGEAFYSEKDDLFGMYYNPALINFVKRRQLALQHTEWFQSIRYEYLSYIFPKIKIRGKVIEKTALTMMLVHFGKIPNTIINMDYWVTHNDIHPSITLGEYSALFQNIMLTKALQYKGYDLGISAKLLISKIAQYYSYNYAADAGVVFNTFSMRESLKMRDVLKKLLVPYQVGVSVRNIGPPSYFVNQAYADPQPTEAALGFTNKWFNEKLNYNFSLRYRAYYGIILGQGIEYSPFKMLSLRAGYMHKFIDSGIGALNDFSGGLGFNFNIADASIHIDYALKSFGKLGWSHYISTRLKF